MLFCSRYNYGYESAPVVFDGDKNLHCVDVVPLEGINSFVHLWTNYSSGRAESTPIAPHSYQKGLSLFVNSETGGIDFLFREYNLSLGEHEFLQYSADVSGKRTLTRIAGYPGGQNDRPFHFAWNGTHPFILRLPHSLESSLLNLSVLWPGESTFSAVGSLDTGDFIRADILEDNALILWTQVRLNEAVWGEYTRRILAWKSTEQDLICIANVRISNAMRVFISRAQEGYYWLLVYSGYAVTLYRFIRELVTGNYTMTQEYQQSMSISNHEMQLGVRGLTPFIVYMAGSSQLENPEAVPFIGYWTSTGDFVSEVLDTNHHFDAGITLYDPIGNEGGLFIPYFIEDVTGYSEGERKDGKAPYIPKETQENNIDPNQDVDGVYLATNISGVAGLKPALFNLKEAQAPLLPSFWPWLAGSAVLGLIGVSLGYWRFKRSLRDLAGIREKIKEQKNTVGGTAS
jgi:hypothetical protein